MNIENTMNKYFLFLFILITQPLYSQPNPEWVMRYENSSGASVKDMFVDKQGNVYLAGAVISSQKLLIIKYNTSGTEIWSRTLDSVINNDSRKMFIAADDSGQVYVLSPGIIHVQSIAMNRECTRLVKYSSGGKLLWERKYINEDSLFTICKGIVLDDSSNVYAAAETWQEGQSSNYTTLKYNSEGNFKWIRVYDSPSHIYDSPTFLSKDIENNIYITGSNTSTITTVKYNSFGDSLWVLRDNPGFIGLKIIVDDSLNVFVGGNSSVAFNGTTFTLKKFNNARNLIWQKSYNNPTVLRDNNNFSDFTIDKNSNSFITGVSGDTMELAWDYASLRYNGSGDSIWTQKYSPVHNSDDRCASIAVDKLGNCIVTGKSNDNLFGYKYLTIVYAPAGQQRYLLTYNNNFPNGNHEAIKVLTDTSGNIYITGNSQTMGGVNGIATLKYGVLTGLQQTTNFIPDKFELGQNYPNPFNPDTNIKFKISYNSKVKVTVFDILGKEIETLVDKNFSPGEYKVQWNASERSSGIYFYCMFSDGLLISAKSMSFRK